MEHGMKKYTVKVSFFFSRYTLLSSTVASFLYVLLQNTYVYIMCVYVL